MAKHIKTDGTVRQVIPERGKSFSRLEIQSYVAGDFEFVGSNRPEFIIAVNDEGRNLDLPPNGIATALVNKVLPPGSPPIVGNVLIGTHEEFGFHDFDGPEIVAILII